jgi:hypothetical protein
VEESSKEKILISTGSEDSFTTGAVRGTDDNKERPDLVSPWFQRQLSAMCLRMDPAQDGRLLDGWSMAEVVRAYRSNIERYREGFRDRPYIMVAGWFLMQIVHFDEAKTWWTGIGVSPIFHKRLTHWITLGARRYQARNWEKGINLERTARSLCRHLDNYVEGEPTEDHLAASACNIMFLSHTEAMILIGTLPKELDDLPRYTPAA